MRGKALLEIFLPAPEEERDTEGKRMDLAAYSPLQLLESEPALRRARLPPGQLRFLHGKRDSTVSCAQTLRLAELLRRGEEEGDGGGGEESGESRVSTIISTEFGTHTKSVVEGPLAGRDPVAREVLKLALTGSPEPIEWDEAAEEAAALAAKAAQPSGQGATAH